VAICPKCVLHAGQMQMIRALVFALAFGLTEADQTTDPKGDKSCPCLSDKSTGASLVLYNKIKAAVGILPGLRKDYGLDGCKAYDQNTDNTHNLPAIKCVGVPKPCAICKPPVVTKATLRYCFLKWCYVDPNDCPLNKQACEGAMCGKEKCKVGDPANKFCRTRKSTPSEVQSIGSLTAPAVRYSYHTCHNMDYYSPARVFSEFYGNNILAGPLYSKPWSFTAESDGRWIGILPDFMKDVASSFLKGELILANPPVSEISMKMVADTSGAPINMTKYKAFDRFEKEKMFQACVNDVGLGRLDICLGDFWVTSERYKMVNFLPPYKNDALFLFRNSKESDEIVDILQKPFMPFEWSLWGFICVVLVVMGLLLACAEYEHNEDDFPDQRWWVAAMKGVYISAFSYMNQGPQNNPMTPGGRLMSMGLGLFLILAISAYTANLATFLMMKNYVTGIENLQDAITKGYRICIDPRLYEEMSAKEPAVKSLLVNGSFGTCPKMMHMGEADAAIMAQSQINEAYAGSLVRADCKYVDKWEGVGDESVGIVCGSMNRDCLSDPRAGTRISGKVCPNRMDYGEDDDGLYQERDCFLKRISKTKSDYLLSVTLAIPVRHQLQNALGWGLINSIAEGNFEKIMKKYGNFFPKQLPNCPPLGVSESASMEIKAMVGTTLATSLFFVFGGFCLIGQKIRRLKQCQRSGAAGDVDEAEEAYERRTPEEERIGHIQDGVGAIHVAIDEGEQRRTDQWTTLKEKMEQVSKSIGQLETKNAANEAKLPDDKPAPVQEAAPPAPAVAQPAVELSGVMRQEHQNMASKWQLMLKDVRDEKASADQAWQQVVEERQRVKEEWASMEKITRESREALTLSSGSPPAAAASLVVPGDNPDDKEFQAKMDTLHKLERSQLDAAWNELRSERKDVQESLKQSREMHAEVALMLKKAQEEATRTGGQSASPAPPGR